MTHPPASSATVGPGVHIVATAARCAVGLTSASSAAAIRASISNITEHPFLEDAEGQKIFCGREPTIDPMIVGSDRIVELAHRCLEQMSATLAEIGAWKEVIVLVAAPESRPGFEIDRAQQFFSSFLSSPLVRKKGVRAELVGEGHGGALAAVDAAVGLLARGREEIVLVAGVDSYLDPQTIRWLDGQRRLARPGIRSGFAPGEAVAMIALATDAVCSRLGLESLARVRGVACRHERRSPQSDTGLLGEALSEALLGATADLGVPDEVITDLYGDINGERGRTDDWAFALMRTATRFRDGTDYVTPVGQCGDVGAASAALGCVLATEAWKFHRARGPLALIWAGSWSGLRAAAVLERDTV